MGPLELLDPQARQIPGLLCIWGCWIPDTARAWDCQTPGTVKTRSSWTPTAVEPVELLDPGTARPRGLSDCWGLSGLWSFQTAVTAYPRCYRFAGHPHPEPLDSQDSRELLDPRAALEAMTPHPLIPPRRPSPISAALPSRRSLSGSSGRRCPGPGRRRQRPPEPGPPSGEPMRNFLAGGGAPPAATERGAEEAAE